jgi:hypothetical protein
VTVVENAARCPWQAFVVRLLRVVPPPDPHEALPGSNPRLIGMTVHHVLDRIVRSAVKAPSASLAEAAGRRPVAVGWPDSATLDAWLADAGHAVLDEEGIALRGLARVLAEQARPLLARARELDWPEPDGAVSALGGELEGALTLRDDEGATRTIRFRADRADRCNGALRLTDYKTGRPISNGQRAETRMRHFLAEVAQGARLQAVVYALCSDAAAGRLLFLRPDLDPAAAVYPVCGDDADFTSACERSLRAVLGAWDRGSFFPRLVSPDLEKEPALCERCEVAEACLRGDTGARRRLVGWLEGRRAAAPRARGGVTPAEQALLGVWELHAAGRQT